MTVAEVNQMSQDEFMKWSVWFGIRHAKQNRASQKVTRNG